MGAHLFFICKKFHNTSLFSIFFFFFVFYLFLKQALQLSSTVVLNLAAIVGVAAGIIFRGYFSWVLHQIMDWIGGNFSPFHNSINNLGWLLCFNKIRNINYYYSIWYDIPTVSRKKYSTNKRSIRTWKWLFFLFFHGKRKWKGLGIAQFRRTLDNITSPYHKSSYTSPSQYSSNCFQLEK